MTSNTLQISSVGPSPFSTFTFRNDPPQPSMSYTVTYPMALHNKGVRMDSVRPSRDPSNFFAQQEKDATPVPLPTNLEQALAPDVSYQSTLRCFSSQIVNNNNNIDSTSDHHTLPRDTLHPFISEMQAEENAKAAYFHREVSFLANARRDGPPCQAHQPPPGGFNNVTFDPSELEEAGTSVHTNNIVYPSSCMESNSSDTFNDAQYKTVYSKRGTLSTVAGRRYYTDGHYHDPGYYAANVLNISNNQPSLPSTNTPYTCMAPSATKSLTALVGKALANALHNPTGEEPVQIATPSAAFRNLSPGLRNILAKGMPGSKTVNKVKYGTANSLYKRCREGRHEVDAYLLGSDDGRHKGSALMLPSPLVPDKGVDVNTVDIPYDPFLNVKFNAINDPPEEMDKAGMPPIDREHVPGGGPHSVLSVWASAIALVSKRSKLGKEVRETDGPSCIVDTPLGCGPSSKESGSCHSGAATKVIGSAKHDAALNGRHLYVLAPELISFFDNITNVPKVHYLLTGKGIRQGDVLKQPTAQSQSSFSSNGVIPATQFTQLEQVPPNCFGFDSERFANIIRLYGAQLEELFLEGCSWLSPSVLETVGTFCSTRLSILNLSYCQQLGDEVFSAIAAGCPMLQYVNLTSCSGLSSVSVKALLVGANDLIGIFLGRMELLDSSMDPCWSELHRHRNLSFVDISFCFNVTDAAVVKLAQFCENSLEVLDISGCASLTDLSLKCIGGSMRKLKVLRMKLCSHLSADLVGHYLGVAASNLETLAISGHLDVNAQILQGLFSQCTKIKYLDLSNCSKIDNDALFIVQKCVNRGRTGSGVRCLETIDLSSCFDITAEAVMQLIYEVKSIVKVVLNGTHMSRTEMRMLSSVRESCDVVKIEDSGIPKIKKKLHAFALVEPLKVKVKKKK